LTVVTIGIVAVPPALAALASSASAGLKLGSRGVAIGSINWRRPTARGLIVGLEAALAMLLIVAAGLLVDSFRRIRGADLGVNTDNVLTFWIIPSEARVRHR
jgi:hypothetical protein